MMSVQDNKEPSTEGGLQKVSEVIQKFIQRFQKSLKDDKLSSTQTIYLYISEKLILPETIDITEFVGDDKTFLIFYEQMYNRQVLTTNKQLSLKQQIKSFETYQSLFHHILEGNLMSKLRLPDQWLWDIIEDFVEQYESFCHYRENLSNKSAEEIKSLKSADKLWDILYVLETLHKLVKRAELEIQSSSIPKSSMFLKLGHFAIYGLLKVYTIQADYYNAISILDIRRNFPTNISKVVFSRLPECQFSVAYHAAFSYMMMRRYVDAIDIILNTLRYFQENMKLFNDPTHRYNKIRRYVRNMLNLLCISLVLQHITNTVTYTFITESAINKLFKGNKCEEKVETLENELIFEKDKPEFKNVFLVSCPNFVLIKAPSLEDPYEDYSMKVTQNQLKVFMTEVNYHDLIPHVKFELEITLVDHDKVNLVRFMKENLIEMAMDQTESYDKIQNILKQPRNVIKAKGIQHLLRIKHKQTQAVRLDDPNSSGLESTLETASGVDFFVDRENILVYGDGFFSGR